MSMAMKLLVAFSSLAISGLIFIFFTRRANKAYKTERRGPPDTDVAKNVPMQQTWIKALPHLRRKPLQDQKPIAAMKMLTCKSTIHEVFSPFLHYIDELVGVHDIAIILMDHKSRQCALLKRNGTDLVMMDLIYDQELITAIRDVSAGLESKSPPAPQHAFAQAEPRQAQGEFEAAAPDTVGTETPDTSVDISKELSLINDLYRIALSKYKQNLQLKKMSEIDGLTGLSNHRHFQEQLDQEIKHARRLDRALSLVFFDIDHFKTVNDTYGHQTGDHVLQELARFVKSKLRDTDLIARYGGEEFAVILPATGKIMAGEVAERIRKAVEQHEFTPPGNKAISITISMGISDISDGGDRHEFIKAADAALYRAKKGGRNRVST